MLLEEEEERGETYSVKKEKGGEVGCVERVKHINKLSTVDGIGSSEPTPWEDTELEELSDGSILQHLCNFKNNNSSW